MIATSGALAEKPNRQRKVKQPGGPGLVQDSSRQAKQVAAAIFEVLAGARTPQQAAEALAMSLPRYYQLESRALRAVVLACESRPKGRVRSPASELAKLKAHNEHLQREVTRQQALVRIAQRSVGLAPPPTPAPKAAAKNGAKRTRRRRPAARALSVAKRLRQDAPQQTPTASDPQATEIAAPMT